MDRARWWFAATTLLWAAACAPTSVHEGATLPSTREPAAVALGSPISWPTEIAPSTPGGLVAFVDPEGHLAEMAADGSDPRRLTTGAGTVVSADWSPDGRSLAYIYGTSLDEPRQVAVYEVGRGQAVTLTVDLANPWLLQTMSRAQWSPNGRHLLLDSGTGPRRTLTVVDPETGATQASLEASGYAWAPDGERLAFGQPHALPTPIDLGDGGSYDLALFDIAEGAPTVLLEGTAEDLYTPTRWLGPGDLRFDHLSWDEATQTDTVTHMKVEAEGAVEPRPATDAPPDRDALLERLPADFQSASTGAPSWSPDGAWLVFEAGSAPPRRVYLFDWDNGGEPVPIADGTSPVWQPRVSPATVP